ncbi:plasmid mobilization protein [Subtercola boreus]|uniref:plasmid mobilization protein n=1 Tax=Subtercola boreus TaxID=120213 RepID=UPI003F593DDE
MALPGVTCLRTSPRGGGCGAYWSYGPRWWRVRCAGPEGIGTVSESSREGRLFGRRRRANVPVEQRRTKRYEVSVTPTEDAHLRARAEVLGVTVPRLLFESAMNAQVRTDTEWKLVGAELFRVSRLLKSVSDNMNQLARFANTEGVFPAEAEGVFPAEAEGVFPAEAEDVYAEYRRLVPKLEATIDRLAGQ